MTPDWHTTLEGREALSLRMGTMLVPILRLSTGRYAVFNHAYELCGIIDTLSEWPPSCWHPAAKVEIAPLSPSINLHDLGLL